MLSFKVRCYYEVSCPHTHHRERERERERAFLVDNQILLYFVKANLTKVKTEAPTTIAAPLNSLVSWS
jgi:hypothetical protein